MESTASSAFRPFRKVVTRVHQVTRNYDVDVDPLTEQTIDRVLNERPSAQASRR